MTKQSKEVLNVKKGVASKQDLNKIGKARLPLGVTSLTAKTKNTASKPTSKNKVKALHENASENTNSRDTAFKHQKPVKITEKEKKLPKEKVIRDSFTMPRQDYEKIAAIKETLLKMGVNAKKNEVLRAGLYALEALADKDLIKIMGSVEHIKAGRPK